MKNACSYIDYLFRRITFTETEKRKPTVRVRVSCRTLYQIGMAKFLGVGINWRSSKSRKSSYIYIHVYKI